MKRLFSLRKSSVTYVDLNFRLDDLIKEKLIYKGKYIIHNVIQKRIAKHKI